LAVLHPIEGGPHEWSDGAWEKPGFWVESIEGLSVPFDEFGFVVPRIDLALAAVHEEPDDGAGFGFVVGLALAEGLSGCGFSLKERVCGECSESGAG
jgi:hypothetical protein